MVTTEASVTVHSREGMVVLAAHGLKLQGELRLDYDAAMQLADEITIVAETLRYRRGRGRAA